MSICFDSFGSREFIDRRNSQDRFALIQRLHGQGFFALIVGLDHGAQVGHAVGGSRKIVLREDRFDAGHRQSLAHIEMLYPPMRHGTEQQLAEQHAVGAKIFGILRFAGHLRVQDPGW